MGDYSKKDPNAVAQHIERRTNAMAMKAEGDTYQQIADALGYANRGHAWKDVQKALDELRETEKEEADRLRVLHRVRLDTLLQAVWPRATGQDPNRPGVDLKAVEVTLRIMERQSKLEGLDAPIRTDITVSQNVDARIVELMKQLGLDPGTPQTIAGEIED